MSRLELIATTAFGLEAVVGRELADLGYTERTIADGRVTFIGDEAAICRANIHLRSAERVFLKLAEFETRDFGELFDRTFALPWAEWLPADAEFPVRGKSIRSQLASVPDCQKLVKKAIVEKLKETHDVAWFEETGAAFAVEVSILRDRVTIAIDTTGADGLHKRGYRTLRGTAPLKETLAAALVQLSYWNRERPFLDPFCGTGTIPIEAAFLGRRIAPGINRAFASEDWPAISSATWAAAREEARDLVKPAFEFPLVATDADPAALSKARYHAQQAGVGDDIHFQEQLFEDVSSSRKFGCLITNPPYGERLGETEDVEALYHDMGMKLRHWETWSVYVITAMREFEKLFGRKAERRRKIYNGRIECTYYQFQGPPPPRSPQPDPPQPDPPQPDPPQPDPMPDDAGE